MSINGDQGLCLKCLRDGVQRPGVIDYSGGLVCQDHYDKDRALDEGFNRDLQAPEIRELERGAGDA